jgi:hypothetical protein
MPIAEPRRPQVRGKPDLVPLVLGRERCKDFPVYQEITVFDDRMRMSDKLPAALRSTQ